MPWFWLVLLCHLVLQLHAQYQLDIGALAKTGQFTDCFITPLVCHYPGIILIHICSKATLQLVLVISHKTQGRFISIPRNSHIGLFNKLYKQVECEDRSIFNLAFLPFAEYNSQALPLVKLVRKQVLKIIFFWNLVLQDGQMG